MKDKKLRAMLVDCILRYKSLHGMWYERPFTNEILSTVSVDVSPLSVKESLELCKELGISPDNAYLYPQVIEYSDGYPETFIEVSTNRRVTDAEWFEEISNALSPRREKERYDQYLQLKGEFE